MPIVFAPFVGLALGAAFAWLAGPELASEEGPIALSRPFAIVAAFAGLVWFPAVAYFVAFHGDWSYLYAVPWRRVPSAVDLLLALLAGVAVLGGFVGAIGSVRRRHFGAVVALVAGPGTIAVVGLMAASRRLAVSATYAQFHGDFGTEPIGASILGKGVLLMGIVVAGAVAWTARALLRLAP
jgi:hypothetical protein